MNAADRLTWLQKEVDSLVDRYQRESSRFKKEAIVLKIVRVLFAAIITVLLGLKWGEGSVWADRLSNIALILGALITVFSAYEAFFDPRALWVRETVTFARLKDLQRDLRYWTAGRNIEAIEGKELARFKLRLDSVLEDSLKYWMKLRNAPDLEKVLEAKAELRTDEPAPKTPSAL
jgi:hypothetical protein